MKTARYSVAAGYKTGRLLGYRRVTVFLLGVAVGLLVAPFPGKDLRALLQARFAPQPPIPLPAGTPDPLPTVPDLSLVDLTD